MEHFGGKHRYHPYSTSRQSAQPSSSHSYLPVQSTNRSTKKIKSCQSVEQKTQYLERILRMPQQKSNNISSTFDRIRFTVQSNVTTITSTENSYHFISDVNNNNNNNSEYCAPEDFSIDNRSPSSDDQIIICEPILSKTSGDQPWSGFLIDNCDEVQSPAVSFPPPVSCSIPAFVDQNQENGQAQRAMLINELDTADHKEREELKRQKQRQRREKQSNAAKTTDPQDSTESPSDWIIEYDLTDNDQISQLTNAVESTSATTSDEHKRAQIRLILKKIREQQLELKKLREHVLSMLDDRPEHNADQSQDILIKFLKQPLTSGCWLCSGKKYTEVASQCNNTDE